VSDSDWAETPARPIMPPSPAVSRAQQLNNQWVFYQQKRCLHVICSDDDASAQTAQR
jgi:hypothetical protein